MFWRWAAASEIGTSHIASGAQLEDAYYVSRMAGDHILAIVADGAGSAKFGKYGAWIACRFLTVHFREWLKENPILPTDEMLTTWVHDLRCHISTVAALRGSTSRQFASTLALIVASDKEILTIQVGDSAIVGRRGVEWEVLCWPENGEYASTTYFITDDDGPRLNINRKATDFDAFALFSDGIGDLALSQADQTAIPQFFNPMMRPVDRSEESGRLAELSSKLGHFLSSDPVCKRTDDDKTIILISGA